VAADIGQARSAKAPSPAAGGARANRSAPPTSHITDALTLCATRVSAVDSPTSIVKAWALTLRRRDAGRTADVALAAG
jgi:hypothetical protein